MADNIAVTEGSGKSVATDDVGGSQYQLVKLAYGPDSVASWVTSAVGLPVTILNAATSVSGTVSAAQSGTWNVNVSNTASVVITNATITVAPIASIVGSVTIANALLSVAPHSVNITNATITVAPITSIVGSVTIANATLTVGPITSIVGSVTIANTVPVNAQIAGTAINSGVGSGGSATVRVAIDTSQLGVLGSTTVASATPINVATDQPRIPVALDAMALMNNATSLPPNFSSVSGSALGGQQIVASVSGKKIRVISMALTGSAAVNATFYSSTNSAISGAYILAAAGDGMVLPFSPVGWMETPAGSALTMSLSTSTLVSGNIVYVTV